jgi:hypothetical protein
MKQLLSWTARKKDKHDLHAHLLNPTKDRFWTSSARLALKHCMLP